MKQQQQQQQHCNGHIFEDHLGKAVQYEDKTLRIFTEARDDGVAVASTMSYASRLHHAPDR